MQLSILQKLESLMERYEELNHLLSIPEIISDQSKFCSFSKEYAEIEPIVKLFSSYKNNCAALEQIQILLKENDIEIKNLAQEEFNSMSKAQEALIENIYKLLLPKDPNDKCNVFLEIRAGAGGNEAAIFVGDLLRMYTRYAERKNWKVEVISESSSEQGGYKEIILRIIGQGVYSNLKFESGTHRVQRVPITESQGRIHTSTCTVAIMPEVTMVDSIDINPSDLRIDTYRASGAGGQHVNRTDSAVRITHLPTGIVAECQEERSQHKNKAKAMSLLQAKLLSVEQSRHRAEQAQLRRNLVGTGDRSERIRTYNYPQGRITDHRINLTIYNLPEIMEGNLHCIIEPLVLEHQADLLAILSSE